MTRLLAATATGGVLVLAVGAVILAAVLRWASEVLDDGDLFDLKEDEIL